MYEEQKLAAEAGSALKGEDKVKTHTSAPISLLNVDYKILARILAKKIKKVCEAAISNPQKGFVPSRAVGEAIARRGMAAGAWATRLI